MQLCFQCYYIQTLLVSIPIADPPCFSAERVFCHLKRPTGRPFFDILPLRRRLRISTFVKRLSMLYHADLAVPRCSYRHIARCHAFVAYWGIIIGDFPANDLRANAVGARGHVLTWRPHIFVLNHRPPFNWRSSVLDIHRAARRLSLTVRPAFYKIGVRGLDIAPCWRWGHHSSPFLVDFIQFLAYRGTHRRLERRGALVIRFSFDSSAGRRHGHSRIHRSCVIFISMLVHNNTARRRCHHNR
jgi:hypothetical protein